MKITTLRKTALCAVIAALATGCGGGNNSSSSSSSAVDESIIGSGAISKTGEVDWFSVKTNANNQVVSFNVSSVTKRPTVDLLVGVYTINDQGKKELITGKHASENTTNQGTVNINVLIEEQQEVFVSVRDLKDDEYAESQEYVVRATMTDAANTGQTNITIDVPTDGVANCATDQAITNINETDAFGFTIAEDDVYKIKTTIPNADSTDIELQVGLYDGQGRLLTNLDSDDVSAHKEIYPIIRYLQSGDYKVLVSDQGKNEYDAASSYSVCLEKVGATGEGEDDTLATAQTFSLGSSTTGESLNYDGDEDWFKIDVDGNSSADLIKVLTLDFNTEEAQPSFEFDVVVTDKDGKALLSHSHLAASKSYNVEMQLVGNGPFYAMVKPSRTLIAKTDEAGNFIFEEPYTLTLSANDVADQYEANEKQADAILLTSGVEIESKIAYRSDTDYYKINVNDPRKVLEVYLEANGTSAVDYSLAVIGYSGDNAGVERIVNDEDGTDAATKLKTSLLTRNESNNTYYIRVRDMSDDDSSSTSGYKLKAVIKDIPNSASTAGMPAAQYHSELTEQSALDALADKDILNLLINDNSKSFTSVEDYYINLHNMTRTFADDADMLAIGNGTQVTNSDGSITITFPWISGYVDYQGDQDFFRLNLAALNEMDEKWYYDAKVELKAPASEVEFVWKFHKEKSSGQIERVVYPENNIWGSSGDKDIAVEALDSVTGGEPKTFWASEAWAGTYILKVGDNNLAKQADNNYIDADWSVEDPYFVRLTLTYFPGVSIYAGE